MLEMLINPKKAQKRSWEMFFIGLLYGSLSIFLVNWIFAQDPVLSKYSGILIVTFCVMFSTPFMYYMIKLEEEKNIRYEGMLRILKEHSKAIFAFLWLFVGFIVAFSFWYIVLSGGNLNFKVQIETFCQINKPNNFNDCVAQYGIKSPIRTTGFASAKDRIVSIFSNNVYVLIFTLVFSLIFGAGAIFVLAWNASVIAAAIGIFTKSKITDLPIGVTRYMIHGLPEIAAYFIGALAGGIVSVAIIKHDIHNEKFWGILQDALNLIIIAVVILFISALIEVFITPALF